MIRFSRFRVSLSGSILVGILSASVAIYSIVRISGTQRELPWTLLAGGACLVALWAAWYGGGRFVARQIQALSRATRLLAAGDYSSRIGLSRGTGELGELAQTFDTMAARLEERVKERDLSEQRLLTRSLQQTVVSALGQFAIVSNDFSALLNQAVMLAAQTLEVEYCGMFELQPDRQTLLLRAGAGWKKGLVGQKLIPLSPHAQFGFTLNAGEPVVVKDTATERRFSPSSVLVEHGVVSGMTVAVSGQGQAVGVLGAHTTRKRDFTEDEVHFLLAVATLLAMAAARGRTEAEMEKLAAFAQLNPNPAMELSPGGAITYFNDAARKLATSMGQDHPAGILPTNIGATITTCLRTAQNRISLQSRFGDRTLSWSFHPVASSQVVHAYVEDVTERLSLEAQLRQSQKMESVGQLAAGVAHDFNNMLTIIQGHSGMLLAKSAQRPEFQDSSQAIYFAAERAANLTRQLLMFSRKNVMQPKPLDLREVVSHLSKMLQRLLGETIRLEFSSPPRIPRVYADRGMVEQVIMNLAVNARDAMPRGGTLRITANPVDVSADYVQVRPEARTGSFICLQVSDTGCGMDHATMARIFEPFFTTKEVGKGTGLGLATVYGIVKQHDGWIEAASEPGHGASFSVYFPASSEPVNAATEQAAPASEVRGGKETILIVEDEPVLREMAQMILKECGYRTLEAASGCEAMDVWAQHRNSIDLVLTDVVMPEGMSGMDLAGKLLAVKPDLRIIFASGYSLDDVDTDFLRKGQGAFLQKPYTHLTLAKTVRDCLDRR